LVLLYLLYHLAHCFGNMVDMEGLLLGVHVKLLDLLLVPWR
jgi:hypothetical protein